MKTLKGMILRIIAFAIFSPWVFAQTANINEASLNVKDLRNIRTDANLPRDIDTNVYPLGRTSATVCTSGALNNCYIADQVTAVYSKMSYVQDKEQFAALNAKVTSLEENIKAMTTAFATVSKAIEDQNKAANALLQTTIVKRFDLLPAELLTNQAVKDAFDKLKMDIMVEVEKKLPRPATPPAPAPPANRQ